MFFLIKKQINFIMYAKKKNPTRYSDKNGSRARSTLQVSHIYQTNQKMLRNFRNQFKI